MQKKKYNVTGFAKLCGVTPRTLKYYEEKGLFQPESADANGYRIYGEEQVDEISAIRLFKEHGLSLEEIREILSGDDVESVLLRLRRQQELLEKKIGELKRQQYFVKHTLRYVQAAAEHMDVPFLEECPPLRIRCMPPEDRMVNYLLKGFENGVILDGETFALTAGYQTAKDGEILLAGRCVSLYCMGMPLRVREKLKLLRRAAEEQGIRASEIYCSEILERAGGGQGLFRYFAVEKKTAALPAVKNQDK